VPPIPYKGLCADRASHWSDSGFMVVTLPAVKPAATSSSMKPATTTSVEPATAAVESAATESSEAPS